MKTSFGLNIGCCTKDAGLNDAQAINVEDFCSGMIGIGWKLPCNLSKHEIRNPKQSRSTKFETESKHEIWLERVFATPNLCLRHSDFEFRICFEFRAS